MSFEFQTCIDRENIVSYFNEALKNSTFSINKDINGNNNIEITHENEGVVVMKLTIEYENFSLKMLNFHLEMYHKLLDYIKKAEKAKKLIGN